MKAFQQYILFVIAKSKKNPSPLGKGSYYSIFKKAGKAILKTVTISPHRNDPTTAHITDFLKSNFKKAAIAVPVHTPVVGRGIAINVISAISSNFSNLSLFLFIFLSIRL